MNHTLSTLLAIALLLGSASVVTASTPILTQDYSLIVPQEGFQNGRDLHVDQAGNAYVLTYFYVDHPEIRVNKITPNGELDHQFHFPVGEFAYTTGMAVSAQGDVYVTGWTSASDFPVVNALQDQPQGSSDAFLVKWSGTTGEVEFATYLGGTHPDQGWDVALTPQGNVVVVGATSSPNFPTVNPLQDSLNLTACFCDDVFVTELTPDGSTIVFSTYLGGTFDDKGKQVAIGPQGQIYIAGDTDSHDFPLNSPFQDTFWGEGDGMVFGISSDRSQLSFSSFFGGEEVDRVRAIAVDAAGDILLTGNTQSQAFPTTAGSYQSGFVGGINECGGGGYIPVRNCSDFFVLKVSEHGDLVMGTFLGGIHDDEANGISSDVLGRIYVIGYASGPFPGAPDIPAPGAGIVISVLDPTGSELLGSHTRLSPVANAGHGIEVVGTKVYACGSDNVPSDMWIARFQSNLELDCLDFTAPDGVGMEDFLMQGTYWSRSQFDPLMDLNQDGRVDQRDLLLMLDHLGAACR